MLFKVHSFTDFIWMLFWNALAIALLHIVGLYFCVKLSPKSLDFNRPRFAPKKWEHDGRFYRDKLKINIWKDYMPQYVGKDGFSKEKLEKDVTIPYLEEFLAETCRGEWYHSACLTGILFLLLVNPALYGIVFSSLMFVGHSACIVIQRYNRFRLLILRKKLIRDAKRQSKAEISVAVPITSEPIEEAS